MIDHRLLKPTTPAHHDNDNGEPSTSAKQELDALLRTWTPPTVDANGFLPVENACILEAKALRHNFTEIAAMLPGRNAQQVQRQWNYLVSQQNQARQIQQSQTRAMQHMQQQGMRSASPLPTTRTPSSAPGGGRPPSSRRPTPPPLITDPALLAYPISMDNTVQRPIKQDSTRVTLMDPCDPPAGNTVTQAHKLDSTQGILFYQRANVVDPEEPGKMYRFDVHDHTHAACFNIGHGTVDDSPLISWSELVALYVLPDGTAWAEHWNYHDAEDLESMARTLNLPEVPCIGDDHTDEQLFKRRGRFHSRLENIEYECWIYKDMVPEDIGDKPRQDVYYWRVMFDPATLHRVA